MGKDDKTTERSGSSNTQTSENTQKDKAEVMRKRQNHHSNSIKRAFGKITSDTFNDASNLELEDMLTSSKLLRLTQIGLNTRLSTQKTSMKTSMIKLKKHLKSILLKSKKSI